MSEAPTNPSITNFDSIPDIATLKINSENDDPFEIVNDPNASLGSIYKICQKTAEKVNYKNILALIDDILKTRDSPISCPRFNK